MARIPVEGVATRTERIAVLVTPRTKSDLIKVSAVHRKSVNTIINDAVSEYLETHKDDLIRYNAFFGEE